MSFIDSVRSFTDNLFVPKDGLYYQAKDLINQFDSNGDGRINIDGLRSSGSNLVLLGTPGRGFAAADENGNGNGTATIREVRNQLKQFDGDQSRQLDGFEMLNLLATYTIGSLFGTGGGPSTAAAGTARAAAESGASQAAVGANAVR